MSFYWIVCLGDAINLYWEWWWETVSWNWPFTPLCGCCFIMGYGVSVMSIPAEKFLSDQSTWNGCHFPEQFGLYYKNTECPVPYQVLLFFYWVSEAQSYICNPLLVEEHVENRSIDLWLPPSVLLFFLFLSSFDFCHHAVFPASMFNLLLWLDQWPVRQHSLKFPALLGAQGLHGKIMNCVYCWDSDMYEW